MNYYFFNSSLIFYKKLNFQFHTNVNKVNKKLKRKIFKSLSLILSTLTLCSSYQSHIYSIPPKKDPSKANSIKDTAQYKKEKSLLKTFFLSLRPEIDHSNATKSKLLLRKDVQQYKQEEKIETEKFINKNHTLQEKINAYTSNHMSFLIQNLYILELSDNTREKYIEYSYKKYLEVQQKLQRLFNEHKFDDFMSISHSMPPTNDKSIQISDNTVIIHEINDLSFAYPIKILPKHLILPIGKNIFLKVIAKYDKTVFPIQKLHVPSSSEKKMWKKFCPACSNLKDDQLEFYISKQYGN